MTTARMTAIGLLGAALLAAAGCGEDPEKIAALEAENARLASELQKATQDARDASTRESEASKGLAGLNAQLGEANARLKDLAGQIDSAKLIATTAQAQYEEAAGKLAAAEARITELRGSLQNAADEAAAASERCQEEIDDLRAQIGELQTQFAAAIKALEDARGLRQLLPK